MIKSDAKELEALREHQRAIFRAVDSLKEILVGKLVGQERRILETYSQQIDELRQRFEKEFEEQVKKLYHQG